METPKLKTFDLTQAEKDSVNSCLDTLDGLVSRLGLPQDMSNLRAADHVLRWWHKAPVLERPPRDAMITALGATLGCVIREYSAFQWKRVVDGNGSALAVVAEDAALGPVVIWPMDSVAKRFDVKRDGFLEDYFASLVGLDHVRRFFKHEVLSQWGLDVPTQP